MERSRGKGRHRGSRVGGGPRRAAALALAGVVVAAGCAREETAPASPPPPSEPVGVCEVADALGELKTDLPTLPDCGVSVEICRAACAAGDGASCLSMAYRLEKDSSTASEAGDMYRRACRLGLANACTNFAASVWSRDDTPSHLACAELIFERSCGAGEAFACGMVQRLAMDAAVFPEDFAHAHERLERACAELGGFPCRVLARHLEAGDFGTPQPERIPSLLRQACEGGDPAACGEHATASETFR